MTTVDFLRSRHSIRRYTDRPLSEDVCRKLRASITMINTHEAGMHFELVCGDPSPFKGFRASYGMLHGVRNYIAVVVDTSFPDAIERAGFYSQKLVMEVVALGLGSCYVGGTFDAGRIKIMLRAGWKLLFIVAIGYAEERQQTWVSSLAMKMAHRNNRCADDFFVEAEGMSLDEAKSRLFWLDSGLKGLASAPSSLNRQPVRISPVWVSDGNGNKRLTVRVFLDNSNSDALVDLGIGKYNFGAAAVGEWNWGADACFIHLDSN